MMDYKIMELMETYGGSFVQAFADCFRKADPTNRMRLRDAFPELFQTYHPSQWVGKEKDDRQKSNI